MTAEWQTRSRETVSASGEGKGIDQGRDPRLGEEDLLRRRRTEGRAQVRPDDGPKVFRWIEAAKKQMRALEKLGIPVVAALEGPRSAAAGKSRSARTAASCWTIRPSSSACRK
jgi:enoyl-CoA hydratase/carnithine racemase